jgi:hypothetical protein
MERKMESTVSRKQAGKEEKFRKRREELKVTYNNNKNRINMKGLLILMVKNSEVRPKKLLLKQRTKETSDK